MAKPSKPDELDELIDVLEIAQTALRAAPPREAIIDDKYWAWLTGPKTTALAAIAKALGA